MQFCLSSFLRICSSKGPNICREAFFTRVNNRNFMRTFALWEFFPERRGLLEGGFCTMCAFFTMAFWVPNVFLSTCLFSSARHWILRKPPWLETLFLVPDFFEQARTKTYFGQHYYFGAFSICSFFWSGGRFLFRFLIPCNTWYTWELGCGR